MSEEFPKRYDPKEAEERIQRFWEKEKIFAYDPKSKKPIFSIDTPPPYPSGDFHMGNVLNWNYFDFVARYKRMEGFNVFFPQGWDVHGLPTEVKVEQKYNVKSSEVPREKWIKMCEDWTEENIKRIKRMMNRFGYSIDWSLEYKTSDKHYMKMVQLSFLDLRNKGLLYRGRHPINWCTRCETAIADAEVEYIKRKTKLNYIKFKLAGEGEIVIATTRPEMLHACVAVAVNPQDERYKNLIGRRAIVPVFNQEVEIFSSDDVDPEFGTGIVMICTFGDKQDVDWVLKHNLPIIDAINEGGKIINAGKFSGKEVEEARNEIIKELNDNGSLLEQKDLEQNVGICWRCKHPIEILNKEQWFVAVTKLNKDVIRETKKVRWIPEHMKLRQINWARSMDWDWVISRQKIYGTPLPVWYCKTCKNIIFADAEQLPVDPTKDAAPVEKCEKCGGELKGETDTMDTWMDSSLTIAFHAGWPNKFEKKLYPTDLQPNGTDIIRTWDYYLMVRHLALFDAVPYKTVLINGMVMGEGGRKMSKSLGNFVTASEALEKSCADALRFWSAIGGSTGSDIPFSWKEVNHGLKFITKLWNIAKFVSLHLENKIEHKELSIIDKWILTKMQRTIEKCTAAMQDYQFNIALMNIENFIWHEFADNYLEFVKHRLYGKESKDGVLFTLYTCLLNSLKLLAPFMPFITEEIYQKLFRENEKAISIHVSNWPRVDENLIDAEAEKIGELAKQIIAALRQHKASRKLALNTPIKSITIDCNEDARKKIEKVAQDIKGIMKVKEINFGKVEEITVKNMKLNVKI